MTQSALIPLLGREFDPFLFASVGEERNGMSLSVLSALARLDVDPWEEAVALARMPKTQAKDRLAALMASTTRKLEANPTPETVAARLVALLPGAVNFNAPSFVKSTKPSTVRASRLAIALGLVASALVGYLVFSAHRSPEVDPGPSMTTNARTLPH